MRSRLAGREERERVVDGRRVVAVPTAILLPKCLLGGIEGCFTAQKLRLAAEPNEESLRRATRLLLDLLRRIERLRQPLSAHALTRIDDDPERLLARLRHPRRSCQSQQSQQHDHRPRDEQQPLPQPMHRMRRATLKPKQQRKRGQREQE